MAAAALPPLRIENYPGCSGRVWLMAMEISKISSLSNLHKFLRDDLYALVAPIEIKMVDTRFQILDGNT
jgi:hypothetical protein